MLLGITVAKSRSHSLTPQIDPVLNECKRLISSFAACMARTSKRKVLTLKFFGQVARLSALAAVFSLVAVAQKPEETAPTRGAILVNLQQPVYPPLARQANIYGEVVVTVTVHPDGKAGGALESKHPMLAQSASDSV